MTVILFDDQFRDNLLPLVFTRPVSELRIGILTIKEKWDLALGDRSSYKTQEYLREKYPFSVSSDNLLINGSVCPDEQLLTAVGRLKTGSCLFAGDVVIAARLNEPETITFKSQHTTTYQGEEYLSPITRLYYPEDIFKYNDIELRKDFASLTKGRISAPLSDTNTVIGHDIFVEEGVTAECATFNTSTGPIYLSKNSQVWEGSHIRGPFSLGKESIVKMGTKIYGKTTIGPHCKVGGEINNSILYGNSSKGHDGYLGNSVLGEWCNIGADSNNSNMKNNYAEVRLWDYNMQGYRKTGLQFCGLIMGDHSKCGINTMFNTGTVVGVNTNIFGAGFPTNFVPDFSWGGSQQLETYRLEKALETAEKVYERRNIPFDSIEKSILSHVFRLTEKFRVSESH